MRIEFLVSAVRFRIKGESLRVAQGVKRVEFHPDLRCEYLNKDLSPFLDFFKVPVCFVHHTHPGGAGPIDVVGVHKIGVAQKDKRQESVDAVCVFSHLFGCEEGDFLFHRGLSIYEEDACPQCVFTGARLFVFSFFLALLCGTSKRCCADVFFVEEGEGQSVKPGDGIGGVVGFDFPIDVMRVGVFDLEG